MTKILAIGGAILLVAVIAAAVVPMWLSTADVELTGHGMAAVFLTIVFSFLVGGVLMFLVFYSARKGYDDAVQPNATGRAREDRNDR